MSVIFGIKENDKIIIAGDKRGSDINGKIISDDIQKITVINNKLCIACAGNNSIEKAILIDVEKSGFSDNMTVTDLLQVILKFYNRVIENKCNTILNLPFCCLIAGQDKENESDLICVTAFNGKIQHKSVPMILFHPNDTDLNQCNTIFVKNYKLNYSTFVENTINDISQISKLVSSTGEKWIYDTKLHKGKLFSF